MMSKFLKDESGATAIEYGLIGALVAVAIVAGATQLATTLNAKFVSISTSVDGAINWSIKIFKTPMKGQLRVF